MKLLQCSEYRWVSLATVWAAFSVASLSSALDLVKLKKVDRVILTAIEEGKIPGAVLWVESKGEVFHEAYGNRMIWPDDELMTVDTVFDVASLTKVLAATPAILRLAEDGLLDLATPVSHYLPEFLEGGVRKVPEEEALTEADREAVTIHHLLTHQSGLPPSIHLSEKDFWGYHEGVKRAATI